MKNLTGKYYFNKTDGKYRTAIIFEHIFQRERCGFCLKINIFLRYTNFCFRILFSNSCKINFR